MTKTAWQDTVVIDPEIHHGTPCIKGTRVPVATIVGSLADGMTPEQIIEDYPQLTEHDLGSALLFAAEERGRRLLAHDEKLHGISLRLLGDRLPIDELATLLDLCPEHIGHKGEPAFPGKGRRAKSPTNVFCWRFEQDEHVPFDGQLPALLDILEQRAPQLRELLAVPGTAGALWMEFTTMIGQGGASIPHTLISRIAALGLGIEFSIVAFTIDDDELD